MTLTARLGWQDARQFVRRGVRVELLDAAEEGFALAAQDPSTAAG